MAELFTKALLAQESRGQEATGVLLVKADSSFRVEKAALTASSFIETPTYRSFLSQIDQDVVLLLGHTRNPTRGTPLLAVNNHPIVRGRTIGVHNGTLLNDGDIFDYHLQAGSASRMGEVDSEAIFALIDEIPRAASLARYSGELERMSKLLKGSYTTLHVHPDDPCRLYLLKYKNPLSLHFWPEQQGLVFSSRYLFLRETFGRAAIAGVLPARCGSVFDARCLGRRAKKPLFSFTLAAQDDRL